MTIVVLGLSITSSWGNGHATTYRSLVRGLAARGHDVLFIERDTPWYAANRDLPQPPYCRVRIYHDLAELARTSAADIAAAGLVIVGSYVPDGIEVCRFVQATAQGCTAFYDIDTPVTLAALRTDRATSLARHQVPGFDLYLSFTGGPTLDRLEHEFGAQRARPLYCSVDPAAYYPAASGDVDVDLGYLGTYSPDRQPAVERLLIEPARMWPDGRFVIAGAQYPTPFAAPANVARITHLAPADHRAFYTRQRFTLNVTRQDMVAAGYSPSVRLFEAAACGTPIISDAWPGLDQLLVPGEEILTAATAGDVLAYLHDMPEAERLRVGERARARILAAHTGLHRAIELEREVEEVQGRAPQGVGGGDAVGHA